MKKLLLLIIFLLSFGYSFAAYTVLEVIDWDTVKLQKENSTKTITVRMIGIDAPESTSLRLWYTQCFWDEATNHLKSLLDWKKVNILFDATQWTKDKYDRTLAYIIWEDKIDYNRQMIVDWFAYEYTYNIKYKRQWIYKQAQKTASKKNNGLRSNWTCGMNNITTTIQSTKPTEPVVTTPTIKAWYYNDNSGCYYMDSNGIKSYGVSSSMCWWSSSYSSNSSYTYKTYITWPRWWCYYITEKWNKEYVDKSYCSS